MGKRIKAIVIGLAFIGMCGAVGQGAGAETTGGTVTRGVPWQTLSFSASKWLNTVTTTVALDSGSAADAAAAAVEADRGIPIAASASIVHRIDVQTTIDPVAGATVRLHNQFWFDPAGPNVLFGESVRLGQDEYLRRFRFTRQGVFRFRREPASRQEAALPPERWSDVKASFYPYEPETWGCSQVAEPNILIYLISGANLMPHALPAPVCVFYKRQLYRVAFRKQGEQTVAVDYLARTGDRDTAEQGRVRALKLAMQATPLGEYRGEAEEFSFLGFKDNIELFFDPAARLPVMISGDIPTVGRSVLQLKAVGLSP